MSPLEGVANRPLPDVAIPAQPGHEGGAGRIEPQNVGHVPAEARELTPPAAARAEARLNAPRMDLNLAGAARPGRAGFLRCLSRFFRNLGDKIFGLGFQLPPSIRLTMPNGESIEYPSERLNSMIKELPRRARAVAAENMQQLLPARVQHGKALLDDVFGGRAAGGPSMQDVADVMLYLETRALQTGNGFTEGAFSVEDNEGRLAQWLDTCPERYQRSSSHLGHQKTMIVDGHLNTHRGIDIPFGPAGLTSGKCTLLFATIPPEESLGTGRRVFLKMESHGCRLSTLSRGDRAQGLMQEARADRPVRSSDFSSMMGHALSFLATRGQGSAAGSRKERIPDPVKNAYKTLLENAGPNSELGRELRVNDPLSAGYGIRAMVQNLNRVEAQRPELLTQELSALAQAVRGAVDAMPDHSHLDVRIGNEVIFDRQDLI